MNAKTLTTADLAAELARRQRGAAKLQAHRSKLMAELTGIDSELHALGMLDGKRGTPKASTTRRTGKRPKNEMNLGDAIAKAAKLGAVLTPAEATDLVLASGYKSTSKSFRVAVSTKLAQDKRFKRVGRGQYERVG